MTVIINGSNTPTAGAVAVGDGTTINFTSVGTAGQVLTSNGVSLPTWADNGSGTVTTASVVSANGFAGTVANPSTTPEITLSTSITGVLKGNGTALSAAVAGTDIVVPGGALGTPSSGTLSSCTVDGTFGVGFRKIPPSGTKTSSYTLAVADVGKYVQLGSGGSIVVPATTFSDGDAITIFNNTSGNITVTCSAVSAYLAGTNSLRTSVTLATRGVANILFYSAADCVITGNVS